MKQNIYVVSWCLFKHANFCNLSIVSESGSWITLCINVLCIVSRSRIPDSVGKDIEKACQSIYPLHDVYVRKVKMLKKPKFECKSYSYNTGYTCGGFFLFLHLGTCDDIFGPIWSPDYYLLRSADVPIQEKKNFFFFSVIVWKDEAGCNS